jgi:hypothetical protein
VLRLPADDAIRWLYTALRTPAATGGTLGSAAAQQPALALRAFFIYLRTLFCHAVHALVILLAAVPTYSYSPYFCLGFAASMVTYLPEDYCAPRCGQCMPPLPVCWWIRHCVAAISRGTPGVPCLDFFAFAGFVYGVGC